MLKVSVDQERLVTHVLSSCVLAPEGMNPAREPRLTLVKNSPSNLTTLRQLGDNVKSEILRFTELSCTWTVFLKWQNATHRFVSECARRPAVVDGGILELLPAVVYIAAFERESLPMFELLRPHILKRISLTDDEFERVKTFFVPKKVRKGQFLLQAGEVSRYLAYVERGCLRQYSLDTEGEEHVVQFAIEDWWIGDMYSALTETPATYNIDALEDSEVLLLESASLERLCTEMPKFERFFRLLLQGNVVAKERRIAASLSLSAQEQYLCLLEMYPTISQRVAQNQIASYLGITPQSLSRIRKDLAAKK